MSSPQREPDQEPHDGGGAGESCHLVEADGFPCPRRCVPAAVHPTPRGDEDEREGDDEEGERHEGREDGGESERHGFVNHEHEREEREDRSHRRPPGCTPELHRDVERPVLPPVEPRPAGWGGHWELGDFRHEPQRGGNLAITLAAFPFSADAVLSTCPTVAHWAACPTESVKPA